MAEVPQQASRNPSSVPQQVSSSGSGAERVTTHNRLITVLSDDNFGVWKWNLKYTLKTLGLYECVTQRTYGTQEQRDNAMAELIGTISDKVKIKVSHCQNPYDLYQAIEALYTNKTSFQATALHMKLSSFKFKSSESISQGISELQNIVSRLKNLGEQVSDHMIEGIVLAALPASFRTFVTVWKGVSENDRTLNNLFTRILAEIEDNKLFHVREDKALLLHGRKGIRPRNNFRKFNRRSPTTNRSPSGTGHCQQTDNGYNQNR